VLKHAWSMAKALFGTHQFLTQMSQIPTPPVVAFAACEHVPSQLAATFNSGAEPGTRSTWTCVPIERARNGMITSAR
jgi:hypothetical protein